LQDNTYLVSIIVPIAVSSVGAVMIVCTVMSLRCVVRRRAIHDVNAADVDADKSTSRVSSVSVIVYPTYNY